MEEEPCHFHSSNRRRFTIGGQVERVDGRLLSYKEFSERFLRANRPVVLTDLMDAWRACADWVDADGRPNLSFFSANFSNSLVQVADCSEKEFTDQKRLEMSVENFINYWIDLSTRRSHGLLGSEENKSLLYLKDWHFVKEYPNYVAYETPLFFVDDWLNLYLDSHPMHRDSDIHRNKNEINCADYRFVYMGPKGTWTPLHADVFRSYSWSANVCGKKLWLFLPPSQCHLLFDRNLRNSVYNVYDDVSETQFPGFKETIWMECTQERNEIIFVPSGWYHQVHNLEDTISINHNWFNSYNLSWVWSLLLRDYSVAKEYIEDIRDICDEFESLCQRNLAANTGMNFYDFMSFITRFALANMIQLCHLISHKEHSNSWLADVSNHYIHNLTSIRAIASKMKSLEAFAEHNISSCAAENHAAFSDVLKIIEDPDFHALCLALKRAYESMQEKHSDDISNKRLGYQEDWSSVEWSKLDCGLLSLIVSPDSQICDPEDLVKFLNYAFEVIGGALTNYDFSILPQLFDVEPCAI